MIAQVVNVRNASLLFGGEMDDGHCDVLLSAEGKNWLAIFD
jgi:hypothetical protein